MAYARMRISPVCNRHAPFRRLDVFGLLAAGACAAWLIRRTWRPLPGAPIEPSHAPEPISTEPPPSMAAERRPRDGAAVAVLTR